MKRRLDEKSADHTESDSNDQDSTSSDSEDDFEKGKLIIMYNTFLDLLHLITVNKSHARKKAKKAKKKAKKAKIAATLGLAGAKQGTSKTMPELDANKTLQGTSNESVQVVTVVKPAEMLENAFNVLPGDKSKMAPSRLTTLSIWTTMKSKMERRSP